MDSTEPKFACPACGKQYRWKPETVGRKAKCACGAAIEVPPEPIGVEPPPEDLLEEMEDDGSVEDAGEYDLAEPPPASPPPAPPTPRRVLSLDEPIPPPAPVPPPAALAAPAAQPGPSGVQMKDCPACGASALATALVCRNCDYNFRTGAKPRDLNYGSSPGIAAETYKQAAAVSWGAPLVAFIVNCCAGLAIGRGNAVSSVLVGLFLLLLVVGGIAAGVFALTGTRRAGKEGILIPAIIGLTLNGLLILGVIVLIILAVSGALRP